MIVLENEGFRVEINPFGAELTSFRLSLIHISEPTRP